MISALMSMAIFGCDTLENNTFFTGWTGGGLGGGGSDCGGSLAGGSVAGRLGMGIRVLDLRFFVLTFLGMDNAITEGK